MTGTVEAVIFERGWCGAGWTPLHAYDYVVVCDSTFPYLKDQRVMQAGKFRVHYAEELRRYRGEPPRTRQDH